MKRLTILFLPILLASCSSFNSFFSPIKTIICKQRGPVSGNTYNFNISTGLHEEIIFDKRTGDLYIYDDEFFETLIPLPEKYSSWVKSTVVNGKLKILKGDPKVWGKATIYLKDLTGTWEYDGSGEFKDKNRKWQLKCKKSKMLSNKITREK